MCDPLSWWCLPDAPLQVNVALIVGFNYLYTFLQFEPKELSEQLKKQGASIPGIRPGRNTAAFITQTLARMSVLGTFVEAVIGFLRVPCFQMDAGVATI